MEFGSAKLELPGGGFEAAATGPLGLEAEAGATVTVSTKPFKVAVVDKALSIGKELSMEVKGGLLSATSKLVAALGDGPKAEPLALTGLTLSSEIAAPADVSVALEAELSPAGEDYLSLGPFAAPKAFSDKISAEISRAQGGMEVSLAAETTSELAGVDLTAKVEQTLEDANMQYGKASVEYDVGSKLATAAGELYLFSDSVDDFVTVGASVNKEEVSGFVKYEGPSLPLPLSNTGLYGLSGELKTGKALSDGAAGENSWEVTYGTQEPKGPLPGVQLTLSGSDADGAKITRPTWSIALMY